MTEAERPSAATVLYIDDDPALRRLVERTLTRHGYKISLAASGDEGLARLRSEHFDAVALDHFMPGKIGLDVLEEIRALPDPPPVIYASGSDEGRIAIAALKAGAADYVIKDVGGVFMELLQNAIDTAVVQDRMRRRKDVMEREMREARERAEMLLREVNHRVANSLALVASFVFLQQKAIGVDQPLARNALADVQLRISAIAQIHRRLYTSDDVTIIDMEAYLSGLIEELRAAMISSGMDRAITIETDAIQMATDRAVSLGVIVTELVTNAYKYAYADGESGAIRVSLMKNDDKITLTVEDDGIGIEPDAVAKGTGLGARIIKAMAASLQTTPETDMAHKGTRVVLSIPAG